VGLGGTIHCAETKKKMSAAKLNMSEETAKNEHCKKGRTHSEETKAKMSAAQKNSF
jgi:hypothetical protein